MTRRTFFIFALIVGWFGADGARAQGNPTKPKLSQIGFTASQNSAIVYLPGIGFLTGAIFDSSIVLDTSGVVPMFKATSPAQREVIGETVDVTSAQATFNLANTPVAGTVRVYRNGIRLRAGPDYTISGAVVTLTGAQMAAAEDVMLFDYRF